MTIANGLQVLRFPSLNIEFPSRFIRVEKTWSVTYMYTIDLELVNTGTFKLYTAISRKVVRKNVHATIPKGNMGYDQYTVPDTAAVEPTFAAFL